jgi:hypothetical protein
MLETQDVLLHQKEKLKIYHMITNPIIQRKKEEFRKQVDMSKREE